MHFFQFNEKVVIPTAKAAIMINSSNFAVETTLLLVKNQNKESLLLKHVSTLKTFPHKCLYFACHKY